MKRCFAPVLWALGLLAAAAASAQTVTLKVHHFLGPQSVQHTTMLKTWCDRIAQDSNQRLLCQIYPAMQLGGSPQQLLDQAKDGVADVVWTLAGYSSGRFTKSQVFELPFMMTQPAATSRAAWDYIQKHAQDEFKDVKLLAVHVHGPGVIFTKRKPVTKLEDFKGLKLRGPTAAVTQMLASLGATPVGMPVPQVPDALAKGLIDGAVIPYDVTPGLKIDELTQFASETPREAPALYTALFIMPMNKARYDALPADLKAAIDKHSGRELSGWLGQTQASVDTPNRQRFVQRPGYNIQTISPAEVARWRKATDHLDDEWVAEMNKRGLNGKAMLDDARSLIQQHTR